MLLTYVLIAKGHRLGRLTAHARWILRYVLLNMTQDVNAAGLLFGIAIHVIKVPALAKCHCVADGQSPTTGKAPCRIDQAIATAISRAEDGFI